MAAAPGNAYTHTIASGESLYTIARRYDVTTQAIVQANGLSSPDKIVVGQKIIIPGRADLLANKGPAPTQVASVTPMTAPTPARHARCRRAIASGHNAGADAVPAAGCSGPGCARPGRRHPAAGAGHVGLRQVPLAGQRPRHHRFRRLQGHRHQYRGA